MSKDLEKFSQGATILQQVDVSDIFTSLALGIAEAQEKLDDNSIKQAQKLADTNYGDTNTSLLELGFVPTFYAFTYADISASLNLKMALKESLDFGFGASANYDSGKSNSSDYSAYNSQETYKKEKSAFKSNRRFSMKLNTVKRIIINENYYKLDTNLDVFSRIKKFHSEVIQNEKIDRLRVNIGGVIASSYTSTAHTILKITDRSDVVDDVNNGTNDIVLSEKTFAEIFNHEDTEGIYGFYGNQLFRDSGTSPIAMEVFFDFDLDILDDQYKEGSVDNSDGRFLALRALGDILKSDSTLKITVNGYTDSSGPDAYNLGLSERRCEAMRRFFVACGAKKEQIAINAKGETLARSNDRQDDTPNPIFRKVSIELEQGKEYIYFDSELSDATSEGSGNYANYFIAGVVEEIKSENFDSSNSNSLTIENIDFKLREDTELEFFAYSKTSEKIEMRAEDGAEEFIKVSENESRSESLDVYGNEKKSNSTFAVSGSIDFRMSKQFEMSMEGNSSMAARLVAVPPPSAFLDEIANNQGD